MASVLVAGTTGNLFLDSLPLASAEPLIAHLQRKTSQTGDVIAHLGSHIEFIAFPVDGAISKLTQMRDGSHIEVALIGREGFYGVQVALGDSTSSYESNVQIPGSYLCLPSAEFAQRLEVDARLKGRTLLYAQANLENVSQFAACNRLHPVNERCARWLLMADDRVLGSEIALTQELLAAMLGVRRQGVSVAAAALETAGFIGYSRGRIRVNNRAGLESAACECYAIVNAAIERLLGYRPIKSSG